MMITFLLNDRLIQTALSPSTTVLDFVRYEADLRGTKIGCREGDCGACTVLVGTLKEDNVEYMSVTSCLTPIANVYGKHVVTVEGLNLDHLNKVQQAIVNHSGTQCGFCTPGFVVSLCGYAITSGKNPTYSEAISSIDGNICRCTGYKSIERAALEITSELCQKDPAHPMEWLVSKGFLSEYFLTVRERLSSIPKIADISGKIPVGGGTDLYVQKFDDVQNIDLKYLFDRSGLRSVHVENDLCTISSSSTVTDMMTSESLQRAIPNWLDSMKLVSSTPIRNIATVAGNLANASPIGDLTIILLAMNAQITLANENGMIRKVFLKDFYKGYKKMDMQDDEIIIEITFDLPEKNTWFNFEKVCKRQYLDIATVNTAIGMTMNHDIIISAHCSAGGVSPVPLYLRKTSSVLSGQKLSVELIRRAAEILVTEIAPISDVRGSSEYKRLLLRQLFYSHFINMFPFMFELKELI
ncbi:MAG: FAD binding domain-containing protein [Ignavibacteria bacterium]